MNASAVSWVFLLISWRLFFTQFLCHGLDFMCLFNMNLLDSVSVRS